MISLTFGATMHFRLHAAHNSKVYDHFTLSDLVLNEHGAATDAGESAAHSAVLSLSLSLIARREPKSRVAHSAAKAPGSTGVSHRLLVRVLRMRDMYDTGTGKIYGGASLQ